MSMDKYKKYSFIALFFVFAALSGCGGDKRVSPDSLKGGGAAWLSFRGNIPGNAGVADESVQPPLGLVWKVKVNGEFRSSPVVDGSRVYIGSTDGSLYAFDRKTGKEAWKFKTGGRIIAPPALSSGIVYVGAGDKKLYSIDARTGKLTQKPFEGKGVINTSVAVSGKYIVFGSYDNYVYVLEKDDLSRIVWLRRLGDWIDSTPTIVDGMVYIGCNDNFLYKFRLADGELEWRGKTGGPVYATPVVADGKAYVSSWDGKVYAFDAKTGRRIWRTKVDEQASASLALYKGKLYGGGAFNGPLFELDAKNGKLLNSFKTWGGFDAAPVISGDTLYAGSYDDHFYAVSVKDFKIKWKRPMRNHIRAAAAVAGGAVYFADLGGRLFAFAPVK